MKLRIIFEERTDVGTRYELRTQTAEDFETAEELVERAIDWLSTKPRDRDGHRRRHGRPSRGADLPSRVES